MSTQPRISMRAVRTMYGTPLPRYEGLEANSSTYKLGAVCFLNTNGLIAEAGADPALILGCATAAGKNGTSKRNIVDVALPGVLFVANFDDGNGAQVTVQTDLGKAYGIAKHGGTGKWYVDQSDTSATRVVIMDVWDGDREVVGDTMGRYIFQFRTAQMQALVGT